MLARRAEPLPLPEVHLFLFAGELARLW